MMTKLFNKAWGEFNKVVMMIGVQMSSANNVMKKLHFIARCSSSNIGTYTAWPKETLKLNYEERNKEAIEAFANI